MAEQNFSITVAHHGENQLITVENSLATMTLSLRGAQVISFIPKKDGRERLWMSPINDFAAPRSIRGGIPVCWPWFADQRPGSDESLPMHGFLRTDIWQLAHIRAQQDGSSLISLQYKVTPQPGFHYDALVTLNITLGAALEVQLNTLNNGSLPFPVTMALHTYFAVTQLADTELQGITGSYRDKTQGFKTFTTPVPYRISGETDRIHEGDAAHVDIVEASTSTTIQHHGHDSVVIWNPGKEGAKPVDNIPDEDYQHFLCIESALTNVKMIAAGECHSLVQIIS